MALINQLFALTSRSLSKLIIIANCLDPDMLPQNVGTDLRSKLLDALDFFSVKLGRQIDI